MPANNDAPKQNIKRRKTLLETIITFPFTMIVLLCIGLFFSIVIEWVCISTVWKEQGYKHSQKMYLNEKAYIDNDFEKWMLNVKPKDIVQSVTKKIDSVVSENTINSLINSSERNAVYAYIVSSIYILKMFIIRVIVGLLSMPGFLFLGVIGIVDGLVQRDLRRFGGGIEHSFLYHIIKRLLSWPVFLAWAVYLSMPFSIHPNWIFVTSQILFALGLRQVTSLFKKYL